MRVDLRGIHSTYATLADGTTKLTGMRGAAARACAASPARRNSSRAITRRWRNAAPASPRACC